MEALFGFKTIWVIESVPDGERKTGKEISDLLDLIRLKNENFSVEFVEVNNHSELFVLLDKIKTTLNLTGAVPLLHFDAHGNKDGIQLKSGDFILYEDMLPILREINVLAQNNLFLIVAACHGIYFATILSKSLATGRCPFIGICGPSEEIYGDEVITGYTAFYQEALVSGNLNLAMTKLKEAIPVHSSKFSIFSSEYLFVRAFRGYIDTYCTSEAIATRIDNYKKEHGIPDTPEKDELARNQLSSIEGQKQQFERIKDKYFMHDLYPDNQTLPDPSFEEMMRIRLNVE